MKYILIIWLTFLNNGHSSSDGSLATQQFRSQQYCESALKLIKQEAKYINGVCVSSGLK